MPSVATLRETLPVFEEWIIGPWKHPGTRPAHDWGWDKVGHKNTPNEKKTQDSPNHMKGHYSSQWQKH